MFCTVILIMAIAFFIWYYIIFEILMSKLLISNRLYTFLKITNCILLMVISLALLICVVIRLFFGRLL
ncbi:hypothetical protein Pse7429DRAFT_4172 [Pseudanabaena biceps PCC 7429]|uniref:Uncharacterized protein n=1 Tax=Pseudanabaena biceps PCC 7429 TaxID=927668 RepID=L8MXH5_9CYAN|nr:hypothetical protein Pse7429DRAFT_4172 [Pseudanabaena biceps PCC 7429]